MRLTPSAQIKNTTALIDGEAVKCWPFRMIDNAKGKKLLVIAANPAEKRRKEERIDLMAGKVVLILNLYVKVWLNNFHVTQNSGSLVDINL